MHGVEQIATLSAKVGMTPGVLTGRHLVDFIPVRRRCSVSVQLGSRVTGEAVHRESLVVGVSRNPLVLTTELVSDPGAVAGGAVQGLVGCLAEGVSAEQATLHRCRATDMTLPAGGMTFCAR